MLGGGRPGAPSEHQEVGERVPAEAVGAVQSRRDLARGEEAGHRGGGALSRPPARRPFM